MLRFHGLRPRSLLLVAAIALAGCAEVAPPRQEPAATAPPPTPAPRADALARASGTLTVGAETSTLRYGYGAVQRDPRVSGQEYVVVLLADRPVAVADRQPSRLAALARSAQLRGLRLVWRKGSDDVVVALYHPQIVQSGLAFAGQSVLSINALSDDRVAGDARSKQLGQGWAFAAAFDGALATGGVAELEPVAARAPPRPPGGWPAPEGGPAGPVGALARLGHEFTEDEFFHTMLAGDLESVRLFLRGGMSPNVRSEPGGSALMMAISFCTRPPEEAHNAIVLALIEAKADVHVRDGNNSTPLIWAADKCGPAVIQALVAAGADVNARANGGATPLMMAEVLGRTENAAVLRKAGAAPWR